MESYGLDVRYMKDIYRLLHHTGDLQKVKIITDSLMINDENDKHPKRCRSCKKEYKNQKDFLEKTTPHVSNTPHCKEGPDGILYNEAYY